MMSNPGPCGDLTAAHPVEPSDPHGHRPVLLGEIVDLLVPVSGESVVDLTAGRGGHAAALGASVGAAGVITLFDRDPTNLSYACSRMLAMPSAPRVQAVHADFRSVGLMMPPGTPPANAVLADLGFASTQVDDPSRGLAFSHDGPLDMRLDPTRGETAAQLVARLGERELADIIFHYGEDPFARRIAKNIAQTRARLPISTTGQLASLVRESYGARAAASRLHPATRTFMALRIAVNDELGALEGLVAAVRDAALAAASGSPSWLAAGARVAIMSFHSLEDRIVKRAFAQLIEAGWAESITRKPVEAAPPEVATNPRARSAKLRAIRLVR
jgi:16S rRNA (cytosine1402-N4)-methyltransferase